MSKIIELTDDQFATVEKAAEARGQSAVVFLAQLIEELRDPYTTPRYFSEDEFLHQLGISDEQIRRAEALANDEDGCGDADV
ncbi:MAG TPA: hypothetical protein VJN88_10945 [Ktedonobacterales bacterium]|nr:hypothetical protein [Ktedonobacterales bacterium]